MKAFIDFGRAARLAVLTLASVGLCFAGHPKIAREIAAAADDARLDVIVQYAQAPSDADREKLSVLGGEVKSHLGSIHAELVHMPAGAIATLANDPGVVYVSPDRPLHAMLDLTADAVNASAAWQMNLSGGGVAVAVIDSGISAHPDLGDRVVYSTSVLGGSASDGYGHGTHVAGIVGSSGKDSSGPMFTRTFKGMAPGISLVSIRVLDSTGTGTDSSVIAGIEQAIQLKNRYNIRVINLSLGRPVSESYTLDPLCQAVEAAWKAGIVVVVAAGNDGRDNSMGTNGYGTITAPGNDPYVITVGAMKTNGTPSRSDDTIASYSSKGPTVIDHIVKPDLVAPGNQVVSLIDNGHHISAEYCSVHLLHRHQHRIAGGDVLHAERHQHGHAGGQRRGGAAAAAESAADTRSGEGATYEDRLQGLSGQQHSGGSDHENCLYRSVRHLHGGRGLSGHRGRAQQQRRQPGRGAFPVD